MSPSESQINYEQRLYCNRCPARFNTVWERQEHERESHPAPLTEEAAMCEPVAWRRRLCDEGDWFDVTLDPAIRDVWDRISKNLVIEPLVPADCLARTAKERDGWLKVVGDIASGVPIPHVLKATGTTTDLIAYFKSIVEAKEAAEVRVGRLTEALTPFAEAAKELDADLDINLRCPDDYPIGDALDDHSQPTAGDCRKALTALSLAQEPQK